MMDATKHQPPVPDKDTGFSKDPAANTVNVAWSPIVEEPAQSVGNMPYQDGQ